MSDHLAALESLMDRKGDCYDFTLAEHNALLAAIALMRGQSEANPASGDADEIALSIARRFVPQNEPQKLAQLQCAIIRAMSRCGRKSTHHVHRGRESLPCYCGANVDHKIGEEL